jgi:signal transduction histidine kinase
MGAAERRTFRHVGQALATDRPTSRFHRQARLFSTAFTLATLGYPMPAPDATTTLTQQLQALETVPDSYIVVSPELVILTASNAYLADTLKRREDLVGRYLFDAFPDNPAALEAHAVRNWRASLKHVIATGQPHQMAPQHYDVLDPQRPGYFVERHWLPRNTPVFDDQGQLSYIIHSSVNVTEEVRARRAMAQAQEREQEALREAEGQRVQLTRLFQQAPAAICILSGPELVYELVNASYQQLFPQRSLLGKPLLEALPELRASPTWDTLQQVYRTGQTHVDRNVRIPLAQQSAGALEDAYFDYVFQARTDAQGQSTGVIVYAYDITAQVLARQQVQNLNEELAAINEELAATNEELHESNTQLTRTNVELDTFVYTASHDLKAPITNIEGIVLALRDTLPADVRQDELVGHLLDLLNQTVARFQVTIGQLTDISRLQLAHTGPAEPVVLATVLEDVRLDLAPAIAAAGTQLTVTVAPDLVVSFSPANLRSIVYNLLSNAIKYRDPERPSQVHLHAQQTPHAIQLTVQDNGLGMSQVQQRQLFGLFQRLHTHVEGTGVGLYITKRLVENAGGTIAVASQPHVSTTFTVTFPI